MVARCGRTILIALACLGFAQCGGPEVDIGAITGHHFELADGRERTWNELRGAAATVLVTLDPECPFCQGYAPLLDSLSRAVKADGVNFLGLYPTIFIDPDSAQRFAGESGFEFPQLMDADCALAIALHARVTPECFLLNARDELVYHGAIDNWAVRAGRHRVEATEHYLSDAIGALIQGHAPSSAEVVAVGCIVECDGAGVEE